MSRFADVSAVRPVGEGRFEADVSPDWCIGGKPNGGYLLAVLARAARTVTPQHPDPVAVSAHYLAAPATAAATVRIDVLRAGRSASQVRARLEQDSRPCIEALLTMATLDPDAEPVFTDRPAPALPPPESCVRVSSDGPGGLHLSVFDQVDLRVDPAGVGFVAGRPGGVNVIRGRLRLLDDEPFDPVSLLYAVDALPPATLDLGSSGWVPTMELTAYVRALPAPGPVTVQQTASLIDGGRVDETALVWDGRGRLVAQCTQLAALRMA